MDLTEKQFNASIRLTRAASITSLVRVCVSLICPHPLHLHQESVNQAKIASSDTDNSTDCFLIASRPPLVYSSPNGSSAVLAHIPQFVCAFFHKIAHTCRFPT